MHLFSVSTLSQPVASVVCSNPSLPVSVSWSVDPEVSEAELDYSFHMSLGQV